MNYEQIVVPVSVAAVRMSGKVSAFFLPVCFPRARAQAAAPTMAALGLGEAVVRLNALATIFPGTRNISDRGILKARKVKALHLSQRATRRA